jgi:hypothetical protein
LQNNKNINIALKIFQKNLTRVILKENIKNKKRLQLDQSRNKVIQ